MRFAMLVVVVVQIAIAVPVAFAAWEYDGSGTTAVARVRSTGTVKFSLPAGGAHYATLTIRRNAASTTDVLVSLPVARFACHATCQVLVRFDDDNPQPYAATTGSDAPAKEIVIVDHDRFAVRLLNAKKLRIEAPFAQGAKRVLKFDVAGVHWDRPADTARPDAPKQ